MVELTSVDLRKNLVICLVFLCGIFYSVQCQSQDKIDIGIFNSTQPDQFEIRLRSNYNVSLYLTNLQFTIKWPIQTNFNLNYLGVIAPFSVLAQGQYQSGGYNYWVFVSPGGSQLNMTSGSEYVCASFSFTQSACVTFEIAADTWTAQNNGDFYIEINGIPRTGIIYQPTITYANAVSPAGNITGVVNTCQGNQASYSVQPITNAQTYLWNYSGNNVNIIGSGDTAILQFSNLATSGYLTVAGNNSCGQGLTSQPLYINVDHIPSIGSGISGPSTVCSNAQNLIYSIPNSAQVVNYNWLLPPGYIISGVSNTNTIFVNLSPGAQSGIISVFLNNSCGNSDTLSMQVNINIPPIADAGNDTLINFGTFAYLDAASAGIPNCKYHWLPENKVLQPYSQSTQTILLTNSAVFTLTVTDTISGCQSHDFKQVILSGGPLSISPTVSTDTICQNDSVQLFANACCGSGLYTYNWFSPTITNPVFQSNLPNPWFSPVSNTTVYLVVSDGFNQDTAMLEIWVKVAPTATFALIDTICQNDSSALTINFTGTPPYSFMVTNNITSLTFNNIMQNQITLYLYLAGSYHCVNFTDLYCSGVSSGYANISVTPVPLSPFISITGVSLTSNYTSGNQWYNATGPIQGAINQQYTPTVNGIYYCIVTIDGCSSIPSNIINVTYIGISEMQNETGIIAFPNPAGDFITLRISGDYNDIKLSVFNIIGQAVKDFGIFKTNDSDLQLPVSDLKSGMYFFSIVKNGTEAYRIKFLKE